MHATMGLDTGMPKKQARYYMPDSWKSRIREWLVTHPEISQQEFAARVGCKPSTMTRMLRSNTEKGSISSSKYAPKMAKLTGIPLPPPDADEEADGRYERWAKLQREDPHNADIVDALVSSFLGARKKPE